MEATERILVRGSIFLAGEIQRKVGDMHEMSRLWGCFCRRSESTSVELLPLFHPILSEKNYRQDTNGLAVAAAPSWAPPWLSKIVIKWEL